MNLESDCECGKFKVKDAMQDIHQDLRIKNVLRMHAGVRQVAVIQDDNNGIKAFVVPDDAYMDSILGRGSAEATTLGKWQKTFDLTQFTKDALSAPIGFNTLGWDSSYTRKAIPGDDIREWVETTVDSVFKLEPKAVYEIGCGTGMLLTRIAPHCDRYVAVDFSHAVVDRVLEQLRTAPSVEERVAVMQRRADNFDGLDGDSFDTVVINSVAQYFPNVAYLTHVLENSVNIVKPGGHVFIGDMRSLPLLSAFASSVELFQAASEVTVTNLRGRIQRRIEMEHELVLSPAYFMSLQRQFPKISSVDIRPRLGRADNEMSRYRYNAILHVGHERESKISREIAFLDCSEIGSTVNDIRSVLQRHRDNFVGIQRIPNSRLAMDIRSLKTLKSSEVATVEELRREAEHTSPHGIHPQDIVDLGTDLGVQVFLSWAACREDGSYDALFVPPQARQCSPFSAVHWPEPEPSDFVRFANAPRQAKFRGKLIEQLLIHCRKNLPEELVPDNITLVDMLVRNPDGDVDPLALLGAKNIAPLS